MTDSSDRDSSDIDSSGIDSSDIDNSDADSSDIDKGVSANEDKIIKKCTIPVIILYFMHFSSILIVNIVFNSNKHFFDSICYKFNSS